MADWVTSKLVFKEATPPAEVLKDIQQKLILLKGEFQQEAFEALSSEALAAVYYFQDYDFPGFSKWMQGCSWRSPLSITHIQTLLHELGYPNKVLEWENHTDDTDELLPDTRLEVGLTHDVTHHSTEATDLEQKHVAALFPQFCTINRAKIVHLIE